MVIEEKVDERKEHKYLCLLLKNEQQTREIYIFTQPLNTWDIILNRIAMY